MLLWVRGGQGRGGGRSAPSSAAGQLPRSSLELPGSGAPALQVALSQLTFVKLWCPSPRLLHCALGWKGSAGPYPFQKSKGKWKSHEMDFMGEVKGTQWDLPGLCSMKLRVSLGRHKLSRRAHRT